MDKAKECWKKEIPVSEQSVKKLVSAILLIFHNYSSNIPENCQVSIKGIQYEAKIFKFRYPEKYLKSTLILLLLALLLSMIGVWSYMHHTLKIIL